MAGRETPKMVECPECGEAMFVEESEASEREEWGEFSAECVECGGKYKDMRRNDDGRSWTDRDGQRITEV